MKKIAYWPWGAGQAVSGQGGGKYAVCFTLTGDSACLMLRRSISRSETSLPRVYLAVLGVVLEGQNRSVFRLSKVIMNRLASLRCLPALLPLLGMLLASPVSAQQWNRFGPGTRTQAAAVYDSATNQMFMFGGQHAPTAINFNDTWVINGVIASSSTTFNSLNWAKVTVSGTLPSDRFGHSAVYNATSDSMIVFGGGTGFPGPCVNQLWVLKHPDAVGGKPTWSELTPAGTPPPVREGHVAVLNQTTNTMIVFGGTDCNGNYYDDLWILSNADGSTGTPTWTQAAPSGGPPAARVQPSAIYDSVNNVMTLFGGFVGNKTAEKDVWTLTNANGITGTPTWTKLSPTGTGPVARFAHTAVYDSANNRMIMYGGSTGANSIKNDSWILTNANNIGGTPAWTQLTPTDTAPYRRSHTAIYDPVSDEMVIFGGDSQLALVFTDDHVFVLTEANGLPKGSKWEK